MATSVIEERKHVIENDVFILNSLEFNIFGSTWLIVLFQSPKHFLSESVFILEC